MDITVNLERLKNNILQLAEIGKNPKGGVSRPSFSPPDLEARAWLKNRITGAGLDLREDGAGNIFGRLGGPEGKRVMAGSHIDSVINGGYYDGPVGVLAALECLQRIKETDTPHSLSLEVASFTDEEGNLVGDFLGSRAFTGALERNILEKGITPFGLPFSQILEKTDFTIDGILEAHKGRPEIEAFLEVHIEQGPVLEMEEKSIGIVDRIAGKRDWHCRFRGRSSHAGTTPFELRQDAFLGLADFTLKATQHVAKDHYGSMLTVGKVSVFPGAFSIVPGEVEFTLDFRSTSPGTLTKLTEELISLAEDIAATRGLVFDHRVLDTTEPVPVPERIVTLLEEESRTLDYPYAILPSGAGHDAQILSSVTDSGMIFIPCLDGISHSPEESIEWEDLERGANLLLRALIRLSS
jgi:N-carbamoyl-L-amino-acid hydrolase